MIQLSSFLVLLSKHLLGYRLNGPGFESLEGQEIFSSPKMPVLALGPTQPPVHLVLGLK